MRVIVAFFVFVAVPTILAFFDEAFPVYMYEREDDCLRKSGLKRGQLEMIRNYYYHYPPKPLPTDNKFVNQWIKCMLQKYDVIKRDDTVNMDGGITIPDDQGTIEKAFPICKNKVGRDIDDTARLMWDCYRFNSSGILMESTPPLVYYERMKKRYEQ